MAWRSVIAGLLLAALAIPLGGCVNCFDEGELELLGEKAGRSLQVADL